MLRHPWVFAVAYAMAIPGFALIYICLPGENFYQSSGASDARVLVLADSLEVAVRDQLVANAVDRYGSSTVESSGWRCNLRDAFIGDMRAEAGSWVAMDLTLRMSRPATGPGRSMTSMDVATLVMPTDHAMCYSGDPDIREVNVQVIGARDFLVPLGTLFPDAYAPGWSPASEQAVVHMPGSLHRRLGSFWLIATGHAPQSVGGYARMIYLSAVTITTLGYGDIVPTSSRARAWIATESVFGVLMAGLFVSSLVNRFAPARGA